MAEHQGEAPESDEERRFDWRHMERWQLRRLVGSIAAVLIIFGGFLVFACSQLYQDKIAEEDYWDRNMEAPAPELQEKIDTYSADATRVETAIYLEQVASVNIKSSQFELMLNVAYRWTGDETLDFSDPELIHFYKGTIKLHQVMDEQHVGDQHYQLVRYDVVINKEFWTPRFPLESHQLRFFMEPSMNVGRLVLIPMQDESYTNPNLDVSGYSLERFGVQEYILGSDHKMLNPLYDSYANDDPIYKTEIMGQVEINRDSVGLYVKCFIALYGTTAWILLCLYICTFRRVDPLGMIGAAFFGAVSNIMVGANLVPDALQLGLLEYTNFFGVGIIIAGTAVVISINAIRKERENHDFAKFYGFVMLALFVVMVLVGNTALPLSAWMV
ncbi:hypothetical protein [Raoultibacter phocaeensis]|uniref:hypothetical protein n=1 Tax=Raoultibacter phocaeensis TaxID=2479841 RepID=UPI001118DE96|nr:hypothetical protein [Raoultibacter phocaeensis]